MLDPHVPFSLAEQNTVDAFYLNAGNIELQHENQNIPGYKTRTGKEQYGAGVYQIAHRPEFI